MAENNHRGNPPFRGIYANRSEIATFTSMKEFGKDCIIEVGEKH